MKKYVKPQIKYENYALSENIASSCGGDNGEWIVRGSQSVSNCYADNNFVPGVTVYVDGNTSCNEKESESYCNTYLSAGAVSIHS